MALKTSQPAEETRRVLERQTLRALGQDKARDDRPERVSLRRGSCR